MNSISNFSMKPAVLLRVAAVLALIQFCAHTAMIVTYVPKHGAEERAVVDAMRSHVFLFSGQPRSYWDFYFGYGLFVAAGCLVGAALFFQLAAIARSQPGLIRPIAGLFLLANIGYVVLTSLYFFLLPGCFDAAIAIALGAAIYTAGKAPPTGYG